MTLLILLTLALVLKLDYQHDYSSREPLSDALYGDSATYLLEASEHFAAGVPTAFYKPPLYSALLHLCDASTSLGRSIVRSIQLVLGVLTLLLVYLLARARAGPAAGLAGLLLCLFHPALTYHETKLLDTIPSIFLTTLAAYVIDRLLRAPSRRLGLVSGVVLGIATLARSANLIIAIVTVIYLAYRDRKLPLLLLVPLMLIVAPVTLPNYLASGDIIPVNYSEGHTFLVGNNVNAVGLYTLPPGYPDGVPNERAAEYEIARRALGRAPSPAEQRDHSYARGIRFVLDDPARCFQLALNKLRLVTSRWSIGDNDLPAREIDRFGWLWFAFIPFPVLLLLGLVGFCHPLARPVFPLAVPTFTTLGALLVFYVSERYRVSCTPFLAVSGGILLARPAGLLSSSTPRQATALALSLSLILFSTLRSMPVSRAEREQSEHAFDIILDSHATETRIRAGELPEAAAILASSIAYHGSIPELEDRLASLFRGRSPEEVEAIAGMARRAAPDSDVVARIIARAGIHR